MTLSLRDDYINTLSRKTFSGFKNKTVGQHLSILNNDRKIIEDSGFESFYSLVSTVFTTFFSPSRSFYRKRFHQRMGYLLQIVNILNYGVVPEENEKPEPFSNRK